MCNSVWETVRLTDEGIVNHRVGPLSIYLKKILNEVWVAASRDDRIEGESQALPPDAEWTRTALPAPYEKFVITPVFPDRSVVVDTDYFYRIYPGSNVRVYCRVPVFVRITPEAKPDLVITELPTVILSGTWFGIFTEGELSYALTSTVRRILEKKHFEPHLIVCPLEIHNTSNVDLKFEKICLRTERLSIYKKEGVLWSDETKITYHSKEEDSIIEAKAAVPAEAKGGKLITSPRTPVRKSFAVRTFKVLRDFNISGF